jgi:hypothetical protein
LLDQSVALQPKHDLYDQSSPNVKFPFLLRCITQLNENFQNTLSKKFRFNHGFGEGPADKTRLCHFFRQFTTSNYPDKPNVALMEVKGGENIRFGQSGVFFFTLSKRK